MAPHAPKSTALMVVRRLREGGFQALLAGGCVRDMLMGLRSSDYDVATDATPRQVKKLFRHVLLVGAKFGVAMVIHRRRTVEVTTFRSDVSYSDGRRPDSVKFTTAREDAFRRDFTVNGMFYDPVEDKVIDYVGGRNDLKRRVIRTIGRAAERFAEDYLRMLRAVRFAVRFDFRIDGATVAAARRLAPNITSISGERILEETSKMLALPSAGRALRKMNKLGLAERILPELFEKELWRTAVERVETVAKRKNVTLAPGALLAELPSRAIGRIIRRWGGSNQLRDGAGWLAEHISEWRSAGDPEATPLCDFKRLLANKHFSELRALCASKSAGQPDGSRSRQIAQRAAAIPKSRIAPPPFVTGADLLRMGLKEGPEVGRIFHVLYDAQLNEEITNKVAARKAARRMIHKGS